MAMVVVEGQRGAGGFQEDVAVDVVHGTQIRQGSRNVLIHMSGDALGPRGVYWEEGRNERTRSMVNSIKTRSRKG